MLSVNGLPTEMPSVEFFVAKVDKKFMKAKFMRSGFQDEEYSEMEVITKGPERVEPKDQRGSSSSRAAVAEAPIPRSGPDPDLAA